MGDYTYYDDPEDSAGFERNVLYHFPFVGDKLIIGRFCAIARGVKFIMKPLFGHPPFYCHYHSKQSALGGARSPVPTN